MGFTPPPGTTDRDTLGRAGHPSGGGAPPDSGISVVHPHQIQRLGRVLPTGGGGGGGTGGAGGGGGSGPGGGGSSRIPGLGAEGSLNVDLPAIIRFAVEASIAAAIQGVAAVTTAAVEARSAADDRGRGLYLIMKSHLRHICGMAGEDDVPSIWHRWGLPVMHYHEIMVIYPYPFLVVITQLFS